MKFGKSIGSQQEGHAELHYTEYKLLKKRIKDVVSYQQAGELAEALTANTAFEEELAAEISQVNNCFWRCHQELLNRTGELSEMLQSHSAALAGPEPPRHAGAGAAAAGHGPGGDGGAAEASPPASSEPSSSSSAAAACEGPPPDSSGASARPGQPEEGGRRPPEGLRRLVDIMAEVDRLRKYAVWNAVAVVKILKKRRKHTNFGLEDSAAERAGWLSRQSFFSGSDFAELHVAIESLGHMLVRSQYAELGAGGTPELPAALPDRESKPCPICLENMVDTVELSCGHGFCWKCFVLGPIAFQPGEYRITQCPICRKEMTAAELGGGDSDGEPRAGPCRPERELTRFLHTYFPVERPGGEGSGSDAEKSDRLGEPGDEDMRDVVSHLVRALLEGDAARAPSGAEAQEPQGGGSCSSTTACSAAGPRGAPGAAPDDFFKTLPQKEATASLGQAQKLSWLQLASTGDPLALDGTMYCSLCSEPLLMEVVCTTPCKHYFHSVCVGRLELPECPLCAAALPFSWFLPGDHPCCEHGFKVVPAHAYRPQFPGGPGRGSGGWPLHRPPPTELLGPGGLAMKSYLHRAPVTGAEVAEEEEEQLADHEAQASGAGAAAASSTAHGPGACEEDSESSSDESGSDSDREDSVDSGHHDESRLRRGDRRAWAHTAVGRIRVLEQQDYEQCLVDWDRPPGMPWSAGAAAAARPGGAAAPEGGAEPSEGPGRPTQPLVPISIDEHL